MKRIVILLSAFLFLHTAEAQVIPWYMRKDFGTEKKQEQSQEKAQEKIQEKEQKSIPEKLAESIPEIESKTSDADSCTALPAVNRNEITVTLMLPFTENGVSNPNALDFYSGVLMAAKNIGNDGVKLQIHAIDCNREYDPSVIQMSNIVVGPIDRSSIISALSTHPAVTFVSPLDPKADDLADSLNVIQIPSSASSRASVLGKWIAGDLQPDEKLYIVRENAETMDSLSAITIGVLDNMGVHYSFINGNATIGNVVSQDTKARILVASDKEWFIRETIRNISAIGLLNNNISLYASAKVRNFENLEVELLHNCNLHICPTYAVDYSNDSAIAFILAYRALFQCEPNSFAFHGYDTVTYLASAFRAFGAGWPMSLRLLEMNGLQASFDFSTGNGRHNTAVRKVIYNRDFSISVE